MLAKQSVLKSILAISISIPALSFASPSLILNNNVNAPSTSLINGQCSDAILGPLGTTPACAKNHEIKGLTIGTACFGNLKNCTARIYSAPKCQGEYIADVVMDVNNGIKSITLNPNNPDFTLTGNKFNVTLSTSRPDLQC